MTNTKFQILMIDDSDVILSRAADMLTKAGFEVFTTTQTYAANRFLKDVNLVIIDYYMPGIGGGDLVKSLRAACATTNPDCQFYLHTSDQDVGRDFKKYGFDGAFASKGDNAALVKAVSDVARMYGLRTLKLARSTKPVKS